MAEKKSLAEVIEESKGSRGQSIGDFDGQVLTFVSFKQLKSKFDDIWLSVAAVTEEGEEVEISTSSMGVVQVLMGAEAAGLLPAELKVVSGLGQYGKPWYGLEEPDA